MFSRQTVSRLALLTFTLGFATAAGAAATTINAPTIVPQNIVGVGDTLTVTSTLIITGTNGATVGAGGGTAGVGTNESSVFVTGNAAQVSNSGTITVNAGNGGLAGGGSTGGIGGNGTALNITANNVTITNDNIITANGGTGGNANTAGHGGLGGNAVGVLLAGTGAQLTNNGTITGTGGVGGLSIGGGSTGGNGGNGTAVRITGTGNTFTNNGTLNVTAGGGGGGIASSGTAGTATAIQIDGNNTTLVLQSGSVINGNVVFGGGVTGGVVKYTVGASYPTEGGGFGASNGTAPDLSHFSGTYTTDVTTLGSAPRNAVIVSSGGNSLAVTPDIFTQADQAVINDTSGQSQQLVDNRQKVALNGDAKSGVAAGTTGLLARATAWAEGFGSYRTRPKDDTAAESTARSGGVLSGLDLPENDAGYLTGFYVGGFGGSNELGTTTFRTIHSRGLLAGGYAGREYQGNYISFQLQLGLADQDSSRTVGSDIAHADYSSWFISPSATIMRKLPRESVTFVPSFTARYTEQFTQSYTESGSTANQSVSSRSNGRLGARAQVEAMLDKIKTPSGMLKPSFRLGLDGDTPVGSESVDLTVLGTNVALDAKTGSTLDGVIGAHVALDTEQGATVYADGEADIGLNKGGTSHNAGITGRVGARWAF